MSDARFGWAIIGPGRIAFEARTAAG